MLIQLTVNLEKKRTVDDHDTPFILIDHIHKKLTKSHILNVGQNKVISYRRFIIVFVQILSYNDN